MNGDITSAALCHCQRAVTPLRDCLATPQRELTRKNQTLRFNIILLMRCGLNTRTRRHIQLAVHRTVLHYIIVD